MSSLDWVGAFEASLRQILSLMRRRLFRRRVPRVVMRLVGAFEVSFSLGFWRFFECGRVFVGFFTPSSRVLVLFAKRKFFLGRASEFPSLRFFQ